MSDRSSRRDRDDDDDRGGRRGGTGFRYQRRDSKETQRRAEQGGGSGDSFLTDVVRLFKPVQGDNTVRILPPTWEDAKHYGMDIHVHYGIGSDNAAYLCLDKMKGKACPICEERKRALSDGDQDYADELRPTHRVVMYVIDRAKEREGVKAWAIGSRMDQDILRLTVDKKTGEALEIDHPENGYDVSFTRDGEGMKTRYSGMQIERRPSPLDNDKALQFAVENPLAEQLVFYSYDHIKGAFAGRRSKDNDDEDDKPKERSRARDDDDAPKRGRSRDDDDDRPKRGRDDDERPARRASRPELDMTWDEVHELSFRKLANLVEEHRLDIDPDASRDDEELADQICEACGIEKKARERTRSRDDDDPPRRERSRDDDTPQRRPTSRDDDDTPRRPLRGRE